MRKIMQWHCLSDCNPLQPRFHARPCSLTIDNTTEQSMATVLSLHGFGTRGPGSWALLAQHGYKYSEPARKCLWN